MILQKLFFYPDLVLKNVLSISYQSYRPQLYNGSVNDPASRYHVCLQDCSVSECVCVHFAGSWTTLYRLVYIYICLCVNISGHACGLVFVCTSMWMCVGEMWVCVWVSYCGLILRGGSTGGGIWNTGSLRSAWKKPQIKWRTFTALLRSTALQPAKVGPWLLTTLTSLSHSLFLPLAPFPHVPCGVV